MQRQDTVLTVRGCQGTLFGLLSWSSAPKQTVPCLFCLGCPSRDPMPSHLGPNQHVPKLFPQSHPPWLSGGDRWLKSCICLFYQESINNSKPGGRGFAPSWALAASLGEPYPRHPGSRERENSQASGAGGQEGAMSKPAPPRMHPPPPLNCSGGLGTKDPLTLTPASLLQDPASSRRQP